MKEMSSLEHVAHRHGVRLIVLFGSRAGATPRHRSDTDLAVLLEEAPTLETRVALERELEEALDARRLDLVVLNTTESTTLRREIARTGRVLYDASGDEFAAFASLAIRMFADFAPYRALRRQALEKAARR